MVALFKGLLFESPLYYCWIWEPCYVEQCFEDAIHRYNCNPKLQLQWPSEYRTSLVDLCPFVKFRRITRPVLLLEKKLGIWLLFGYEYWAGSGVITRLELYSNRNFKERVWTGLVFMLLLNTILGFQYRASTWLRLQTFKTQLENESRIGTPIRRNLPFVKWWLENRTKKACLRSWWRLYDLNTRHSYCPIFRWFYETSYIESWLNFQVTKN